MNFISLLLHLVDYSHKNYHAFFEREISVTVDKKRLSGTVDCIVALGKRSPKLPYFCLHEYKRELYSSNDPHGQVLIAMVASQLLNPKDCPVYGTYIVGRHWYFLTLCQKSYSLGLAYDATKEDDLKRIFMMLRHIRTIVEKYLKSSECF